MNPKIRELWEKAAESTAAYPSGQNNSWETQVSFLDKFAELVAEETYVFMCDATDNNKPWPSFGDVKQHFGNSQ